MSNPANAKMCRPFTPKSHSLSRSSARAGWEGTSRSSAVARVITTAALERVGLRVATIGSKIASNGVVAVILVINGRVDTDLDPGKQSVGDVVTEVKELGERIVAGVRLNDGPHILVVGGDIHRVGVVRVGGLNGASE